MSTMNNRSKSRQRKPVSNQHISKQITSYMTAAGLGAFAFGEAAEAAIVYVDVPDIVVNEANPTGGYFDMDSNGIDDFRFRFQPTGASYARIRFQGVAPS